MNLKSLPPLNHIICKSKDCTDDINNLKKFICPSLGITFFKMRFPPVYSYYITNFRFWVWSVGRSPWGLPADDLKVPVVICPVLTVYFLTDMLLCVPSSVLFQKSCYFVRFRRTCLPGCLRPILEAWGLPFVPLGVRSCLFVPVYITEYTITIIYRGAPRIRTPHCLNKLESEQFFRENFALKTEYI